MAHPVAGRRDTRRKSSPARQGLQVRARGRCQRRRFAALPLRSNSRTSAMTRPEAIVARDLVSFFVVVGCRRASGDGATSPHTSH